MKTTVTVGAGRSIHWGSQDGTMCGAAHRNGRFTKPNTVAAATADCKRCIKIMALQVQADYAEAVTADEQRVIYRAANGIPTGTVIEVSVELAHGKALEQNKVVEPTRHVATVTETSGQLYPYRPVCPCGQRFRAYAAEHAAQLVADDHRCGDVQAAMNAKIGEPVEMRTGELIKAAGAWSAETGKRAELVADPAVDLAAWRAALGPHEEALLTSDGRTVRREAWCACGPAASGNPVRYERWTLQGRQAHGWACTSCRAVAQAG